MRFTAASLAALAGLASAAADVTVTSYDVHTITSCAPTVTDCPAAGNVPTAPAADVVPPAESGVAEGPVDSWAPPAQSSPAPPYPIPDQGDVTTSVITIETCIPTTTLSTITITPTADAGNPGATGQVPPPAQSTGGAVPPGESGPAGEVPPPAQTSAPVFLGAASTASFSSLVAGAAAVAAVFLA